MGIFDIFRRKETNQQVNKATGQEEQRSLLSGALGFNSVSSFRNSMAMQLSAVYCAVNQISNSIAILPIDIKEIRVEGYKQKIEHPLYKVLNYKTGQKLNHFNFIKMLMESVMLKGSGYALIIRDRNLDVIRLEYVDADYVQPMMQTDGTVKYLVQGMSKAVDAEDMIHLFMHVDEQYNGLSVIKYAALTLKSATDAENHADNFFRSGANMSGIIKASSTLTNEQKMQIRDSWAQAFGSGNQTTSVAVMPQGLEYQPISISPEDAQLLETRKFNVIEIARFFCISPIRLYDLSNMSYSTLENTNLSYLQDTLLPYVDMIENEFNNKLFKPSEQGRYIVDFDFQAILETDKQSQSSYYNSMLSNGVMSINEVRKELGLTAISAEDGGDAHFMQISYGTVKNVVNGNYIKDTEQDKQTQKNKTDNAQK